MSPQTSEHKSVLLDEAVELLAVEPEAWYVDATFGRGGHTAKLLSLKAKVLALDWDEAAIKAGERQFATQIKAGQLILVRESFSQLEKVVSELIKQSPKGILYDFGTSSDQLTSGERGFSFLADGELDMRMDTRLGVKAKDLLALIPEKQLAQLFWEYGGEEKSRQIAKAIKSSALPITSTLALSNLISAVKRQKSGKLHPATKVFQALRIAVNSELDEIGQSLPQALRLLDQKGKIVAISFHEGEDRIIKQLFKAWEADHKGGQLTKKPVIPTDQEIAQNPRSRSAKLRAFRKN
ncbi:MAG: 16S rRNA (cytosine(1402)-N(4))-methyltransferase [Candidatus Pacebacteria bacterium CG_4_10_14_0_8_um_filter_43_12]|nr:MAG: 16S rRNA (cytosine(1402)-N(4))-methyltransferase [Candidatus Pacebacteria bacterium CG_4_10_14_0_8_um_filter_43_12]